MDNRPIGVFDSGLGGLTTVKEIMNEMPNESIVYFGDTGRVPYGSRSKETIIRYVDDDIKFLLKNDIKIIIAACGTASSVALDALKDKYEVPILGVVEPAVKKAVSVTKNGRIGVIGTSGTIKSNKFERELKKLKPDLFVISNACPLFVPLVENGHTNSEVARLVAMEYLGPLKEAKVDTIILGCTHYPLLKNVISDIIGNSVELIDPGKETAIYAKSILENSDALSALEADYRFYVSDAVDNFTRLGSVFLEREINFMVKRVDINE